MTITRMRLAPGQVKAAVVLLILWTGGVIAMLLRLFRGLGATTNMSDVTPWGIWIGFDVMSGVALAAGGFVIAGAVYVFGRQKYRPVLRPAILTAFLGYILVAVGLFFDIGQPWRIWHAIIYWNTHSVLFEVAWCVMLYLTVLALEFSPVVMERFKLTTPLRIMHKATPVLVIAGMILSTMHQSSLGSLFLIMPEKISPLWYTPLLPVLFFASAVAVGLAMVIVESNLSQRFLGHHLHEDIIRDLAWAAVWVIGIYLVVRFGDLAVRGALPLAATVSFPAVMFWLEVGVGFLLPMLLLSRRSVRYSPKAVFRCAALVVCGVVLSRLNLAIFSFWSYTGNIYIPSLAEILVTLTLISGGVVAFGVIAKLFPVFTAEHQGAAP